MPKELLETTPYIKEILTFASGIFAAIVGLFTKKMLADKETDDAERLSADDTARSYLTAPLDEYKLLVKAKDKEIAKLKAEVEAEHQRRFEAVNDDVLSDANSSQTLSRIAVSVSMALGQLEAIIETANLSKFDYDAAVKSRDVTKLIAILDSSYRESARLQKVVKSLKKAKAGYTSLLEDSEAE